MRIGRIRVDITDRNSEKTIDLFGRYIKCEHIDGNEYDVLIENERFSDVDPRGGIPRYEPVIREMVAGQYKGKPTFKRYIQKFKRLGYDC